MSTIRGRLRHGDLWPYAGSSGFRVGIIAQPDWNSKDDFMRLGRAEPVLRRHRAGNMDSMINRYTADQLRHDAYTPDNVAGKRPDRATLVYTSAAKKRGKILPGDSGRYRSQPAPYRALRLLVGLLSAARC